MTETASHRAYQPPETGPFTLGVSIFAGVMLLTVACFQILLGIAGIASDEVYLTGIKYTYEFSLTTWGWIHLIIGIVCAAVAVGLLFGQRWSFIAGIVLAFISAIANFAFLPYYPVWAIVLLAFNALVIWALCSRLTSA